jgi:glycerol kinase
MTSLPINGPYILSIDQGTTSTRTVAFQLDGEPVATAQETFKQIYPHDGWVEHDPEDIWRTACSTLNAVIKHVGGADRVAAIGITNQRETTVLWDRKTSQPVSNAIVWQDRRGAATCRSLIESGYGKVIQERTGLIPDSYFSATKIQWILESDKDIRARAERGDLAFGTMDTFLLWRLTNGRVHATDATNASRTMIFDIHRQDWDDELIAHFNIPKSVLPNVYDTAYAYGSTDHNVLGAEIPITALVGDQQGALAGQNCFDTGMAKCTFGTGAFVLLNTGTTATVSTNQLLTTVACRLDQQTTYALEGSVFNAGTVVQWLRDEIGLVKDADETASLAASAASTNVTFVPAFTGLGAPHWDPNARGAILGITRDTSKADIIRAGLEAVCLQTNDLLESMTADTCQALDVLRVDGGMAANAWMLQHLSDITGIPVERPSYLETTVQGAALLAGLAHGAYESREAMAGIRRIERTFEPAQTKDWRDAHLARWRTDIRRVRLT